MNQEEADAIAQVLALREKWAEVSTIKEKWEANKVYCVAPKDVRVPLHLLVVAALDAPYPGVSQAICTEDSRNRRVGVAHEHSATLRRLPAW